MDFGLAKLVAGIDDAEVLLALTDARALLVLGGHLRAAGVARLELLLQDVELLLSKLQKRKVTGASYWYLDKDDEPVAMELPDMEKSLADVLKVPPL